MAEADFVTTGVHIGRWPRSLTRAGRVLVRDGRLELLTSYGREIDSAPLDRVRMYGRLGARRALATIDGTRYVLRLGLGHRAGLLAAVRTARAKAMAERGVPGG